MPVCRARHTAIRLSVPIAMERQLVALHTALALFVTEIKKAVRVLETLTANDCSPTHERPTTCGF